MKLGLRRCDGAARFPPVRADNREKGVVHFPHGTDLSEGIRNAYSELVLKVHHEFDFFEAHRSAKGT